MREKKENAQNIDFERFCGEDGIRTRDPLIANQVLYQLSYIPSRFRVAKILYFLELRKASAKKSKGLPSLDFLDPFLQPNNVSVLGIARLQRYANTLEQFQIFFLRKENTLVVSLVKGGETAE